MDKKETIKTLKRIRRELNASVSSSTSSEKMDKTAEELIALTEAIVILEKVEKAEQKALETLKDKIFK